MYTIENRQTTQAARGGPVRWERPIDFESVDAEPIGPLFLLLTPATSASENVVVLAAISRRLRHALS